jgi:hypothetical protein
MRIKTFDFVSPQQDIRMQFPWSGNYTTCFVSFNPFSSKPKCPISADEKNNNKQTQQEVFSLLHGSRDQFIKAS